MYLGIDLGTGSVKALLLDGDGKVRGEASRTYPIDSPRPGYAETDPKAWWRQAVDAVREACGGSGSAVKGIGLSGQAHGVVVADADGNPLRPAILWPDLRTQDEIRRFLAVPEGLRRPLCNPVVTGMAGVSLMWLNAHEPQIMSRAAGVYSPKDWLRLHLTGERATEPADASMTVLYDMVADGWSQEVVGALGIDPALLAPVRASVDGAGELTAGAAAEFGLPAGIPVAAGLSDTASCLLGLGQFRPGETVLQVGSGIQIMTVVDELTPEIQPFYNTFRGAGALRYKMAALQNGGTVFEWARGVLGADWPEMYSRAFAPGIDNGGVVFLPYVSGERAPLLDPAATASWTSMRLGAGRSEMIRAVFEGVALAVRDSWDALKATGVSADSMLLTGGGSVDPRWRQLLADIVGVPMRPFVDSGSAAFGAAYLGGMVAGQWKRFDDLPVARPAEAIVEPRRFDGLDDLLARFRATYRGLRDSR
jgi:xylulokinase